MFNEDVDWCRRMKNGGWTVSYVPEAQAVHDVGASRKRVATRVILERHRGMIRYFHKHHPTHPALAILADALILLRAGVMMTANALRLALKWSSPCSALRSGYRSRLILFVISLVSALAFTPLVIAAARRWGAGPSRAAAHPRSLRCRPSVGLRWRSRCSRRAGWPSGFPDRCASAVSTQGRCWDSRWRACRS